jgi:hypothetical protein
MKRKIRQLSIGLLIMGMLLSACGKATPEYEEATGPTSTPISPAGADESPISVLPTPAPLSPAAREVAETLKEQVADEVDVAPAALEAVAAEEVQWSDTSLGCPEPGKVYAQVIVPGWRIVFRGPSGEIYDVHTDETQERWVICDQDQKEESPATPAPLTPGESSSAVEAAVRMLVDRLNVSRAAIEVVKIEYVQWSNSCLGCAGPDERCLMVITPGYRVVLKGDGEQYEVHTDESGDRARICDVSEKTPPRPGPDNGEMPPTVGPALKQTLAYMSESYPGFGLGELPTNTWDSENRTKEGILGVTVYGFTAADWDVEISCPVVPEPVCDVTLRHVDMGKLWEGEVAPSGAVTETTAMPALTYEVGECDESLDVEALNEWDELTTEAADDDVAFTHRLAYVCCADLVLSAGYDADAETIRLVETNVGDMCRCMCGYKITGALSDLPSGDYRLEIWGVQHIPSEESLMLLEATDIEMP